jgi:hypothetical protein
VAARNQCAIFTLVDAYDTKACIILVFDPLTDVFLITPLLVIRLEHDEFLHHLPNLFQLLLCQRSLGRLLPRYRNWRQNYGPVVDVLLRYLNPRRRRLLEWLNGTSASSGLQPPADSPDYQETAAEGYA